MQYDQQLLSNSCKAAVRPFFARRSVKSSIGFNYFPSVAVKLLLVKGALISIAVLLIYEWSEASFFLEFAALLLNSFVSHNTKTKLFAMITIVIFIFRKVIKYLLCGLGQLAAANWPQPNSP